MVPRLFWRKSWCAAPLEKTFEDLFKCEVEPGIAAGSSTSDVNVGQLNNSTLKASSSCSGKPGTWKDVSTSKSVRLAVVFGCRYVRFEVTVSPTEPPAKKVCERSAFDELLTSTWRRDCLPVLPEKTGTAKDALLANIVAHLRAPNVGFLPDAAMTEGVYVVRTLANSLWYTEPHLQTIVQAAAERSSVTQVPERWRQLLGERTCNDRQGKKQKRPCMEANVLGANSRVLISVVDKACVSGRQWQCVRTDIEVLAECLQSYTDYLGEAGEKQKGRQSLPYPVRQISEYLTVTCVRPAPVGDLSADEKKINGWLTLEEKHAPVFFDKEAILGRLLTKDQCFKLLRNLHISN